jgi:hypothetical protein
MLPSLETAQGLFSEETMRIAVRREPGPTPAPIYRLTSYRQQANLRYYVDTRYVAVP